MTPSLHIAKFSGKIDSWVTRLADGGIKLFVVSESSAVSSVSGDQTVGAPFTDGGATNMKVGCSGDGGGG